MYRFFTESPNISGGRVRSTGDDVNHIKNVLRMRKGEEILVCTGQEDDPAEYSCTIEELCPDEVIAKIIDMRASARELPSKIYLYQAIPKGDRFETVIEKCVELGVYKIIPVLTKRTIVKIDPKKEQKKTARWNAVSLSAAKQSKRSVIPCVAQPLSFAEALEAAAEQDVNLVPYENAEGIGYTRKVIGDIRPGQSVGIFIGPEGGFEESEVRALEERGSRIVTLGHRILRTDTASMSILAMLMLHLEQEG